MLAAEPYFATAIIRKAVVCKAGPPVTVGPDLRTLPAAMHCDGHQAVRPGSESPQDDAEDGFAPWPSAPFIRDCVWAYACNRGGGFIGWILARAEANPPTDPPAYHTIAVPALLTKDELSAAAGNDPSNGTEARRHGVGVQESNIAPTEAPSDGQVTANPPVRARWRRSTA